MPELLTTANVRYRNSSKGAFIAFRGVGSDVRLLRPMVHLAKGRWFKPGHYEVVVGLDAVRRFKGLTIGSHISHDDRRWKVVGIFKAAGTIYGSEVWADVRALQDAASTGTFSAAFVKLRGPNAFDPFRKFVEHQPELALSVQREDAFYVAQSKSLAGFITSAGAFIAGIMSIGAIFGSVNIMTILVHDRVREISLLRALGFTRADVVISVVVESLVFAITGGLLGGILVWIVLDGHHASTMNLSTSSQVLFTFSVDPIAIASGIGLAVFMGTVASIFPAIRASHLPILIGIRER